MKNKFKKSTQKALTIMLAGAMLCTAGAAANLTSAAELLGGMTVNATEDVKTEGDFEYKVVDGTVTVTHYNGDDSDVVVPGTIEDLPVTVIGERFISDGETINHSVVSVTLPDSITKIGNRAFSFCYSLETVNIPDNVTEIGRSAFGSCAALKSISIPDGVTKIEEGTFGDCEGLETVSIPDTVTEIGASAFGGCRSLGAVDIPAGVTEIKNGTFSYCFGLKSINIPQGVTSIGDMAFFKCTGLSEFDLPEGLLSIGKQAFSGTKIESITLPESLEYFDGTAFEWCHSLKTFTVPACVSEISDDAFSYCDSLEEIVFHNNISSIGSRAFYKCNSLKSIVIPDSVTAMGDNVFQECNALESVKMSNNITTLGRYTFWKCTALRNVKLPENLKDTGRDTFSECTALESITIPDATEVIGSHCFYGCTALTDIKLPDSLKKINESAFYDCTKIAEIHIPYGVTEVGRFAFTGTNSLTALYVPDTVEVFGERGIDNEQIGLTGRGEKTIIYGVANSPVQMYAAANNIPFAVILNNDSSINSDKLLKGSRLYLTGASDGGDGNYTYTYYYKRSTARRWTMLGSENTAQTSAFVTLKNAGEYEIRIVASDSSGQTEEKCFKVKVFDGNSATLKNTSQIKTTEPKANERLEMQGSAEGCTGACRYSFYYKRKSANVWLSIGEEFGTADKAGFKPRTAGDYLVRIVALDESGEMSVKEFEVTVN